MHIVGTLGLGARITTTEGVMGSTRRKGLESSETRAQLIEAASALIAEEGWAAVTARRLADKVGLTRYIVHYYFGTIDDLFVALIERDGEAVRSRLGPALQSGDPLRVIWELTSKTTIANYELLAIAIRREKVGATLRRYMDELHKVSSEALSQYFQQRGLDPAIPPAVSAALMASISQSVAAASALGASEGLAEIRAFVEEWITASATGPGLHLSPASASPR